VQSFYHNNLHSRARESSQDVCHSGESAWRLRGSSRWLHEWSNAMGMASTALALFEPVISPTAIRCSDELVDCPFLSLRNRLRLQSCPDSVALGQCRRRRRHDHHQPGPREVEAEVEAEDLKSQIFREVLEAVTMATRRTASYSAKSAPLSPRPFLDAIPYSARAARTPTQQ